MNKRFSSEILAQLNLKSKYDISYYVHWKKYICLWVIATVSHISVRLE
jgi:hypothetical protein